MQQTVTSVEASSYFDSEVFARTLSGIDTHIQSMTADGWRIVSTATPNYARAPLLIFWQRD